MVCTVFRRRPHTYAILSTVGDRDWGGAFCFKLQTLSWYVKMDDNFHNKLVDRFYSLMVIFMVETLHGIKVKGPLYRDELVSAVLLSARQLDYFINVFFASKF